ncbi:2-(3-amino-3-carboxypropyl)histidine synthase subunit 2-like [Ochlerotatus camptorhynchus]|uniref:2-(3-amino-3-carboxypropyl)histidine synthase subunit 2-like n=1 Tax=Ochlerotatus camptorhynchus TaxID=644619 RepID=UPI0031CE329B
MTSAFSSNEAAAIERQVELDPDQPETVDIQLEDFWNETRLTECADWIKEHNFAKVCLQFPDAMLPFSTAIAEQLKQTAPPAGVYILGDTSYGSCCVDEIAAAHVGADAMIHFGHACLSRSARLPIKYVFFRGKLSVDRFVEALQKELTDPDMSVGIFYDVSFAHAAKEVTEKLKGFYTNLSVGQLAASGEQPDLLCWKLNGRTFESSVCIFIGRDGQSFFNTSNGIKAERWFRFDPASGALDQANPLDSKWLRRRFYYVEKCKDASSLGIVVATLTATGYLDVVNRIQKLAKARGIRTYIISVGKINPAKLANFVEIDCFVLIGCPENDMFTSRDFFKPLVSVFECELAFNPAWNGEFPSSYSSDFGDILPSGRLYKPFDAAMVDTANVDVSLVTGKIRNVNRVEMEGQVANGNDCREVQLRGKNEVAQVSSGDVFQNRSWQGLEQNLGRDVPAVVEEGRSGLPVKYENDPSVR